MADKVSHFQFLKAQGSDAYVRLAAGGSFFGWNGSSSSGSSGTTGGGFGWTVDATAEPYQALVSGRSINDRPGVGAFVSFSFLESVPAEYGEVLFQGLDTFEPLDEAEKALARKAIAAWAAVSGITVFEVAPQEGDIRFGLFDLSAVTPEGDENAFSYIPQLGGEGALSDVFLDKFDTDDLYLYLHEVGHALGLKHPFEGEAVLPADLDNYRNTVMSYTSGGAAGDRLGKLDIKAIRYLYGDEDEKGDQIDNWSWDSDDLILTQRGDGGDDRIVGIGGTDRIIAGGGNDLVYSKEGDDTIDGGVGNDSLSAGFGDDLVSGGAGADLIDGGRGDDTLDGGAGVDTLGGGAGDDRFYVGDGDVAYDVVNGGYDVVVSQARVHQLGAEIEALVLTGPALFGTGNLLDNRITGTAADNRLTGLVGNDTLSGGAGNDTLLGGNDQDRLDGGAGRDTLSGGAGDDTLGGGTGDDYLDGGSSADLLVGGPGADTLIGGAGSDTLEGGTGADVFRFARGDTARTIADADTIVDFRKGDRIDLSAIDAVSGRGDNAFTFAAAAAFSGKAGELRAYRLDASTVIAGDVDGDGQADLVIVLTGQHTLVSGDFVL